MRCFLAIELPEPVRAEISRRMVVLKRMLDVQASWVKTDNLHLTVRFLGDSTEDQLAALSEQLHRCAHPERSGQIAVGGLGAYPKPGRARVLWVGVQDAENRLTGVHAACESAARSAGYEAELRGWSPHVTLVRFRRAPSAEVLATVIAKHDDWHAGDFSVDAVSLFQSELNPRGAVHTRLESFPLPWILPPEPSTTSSQST